MIGFRTIGLNLASALLVATCTWVGGYDWHGAGVTPAVAIIITNVANIGLRIITKTPLFKSL